MGAMAYQIPSLTIFTQPFIQVQIKENIKVLRHWPLWGGGGGGDSPGTGEFPAKKGQ